LIRCSQPFATYEGVKDTDALVRSFDVASALIHVPSEETFGLVVAEALARNVKVFSFRVGGIVDIAGGFESAVLLNEGDWDGLKAALKEWIQAGSPKPGNESVVMRQLYHPREIARRHLEIYREAVDQRMRRAQPSTCYSRA